MPVKKYILNMKSDLCDLEELRSFVEGIQEGLSFSKKCQFETNLALEEAFSNILSYGFDKHTDHFIKITVTSAQGVLNIRVEDDGKPFNPLEAKEPTLQYDIENCALGGLGIHLIKNFMDDIRYQRYQNKNVLIMKKAGCFHEPSNFRNPLSSASRSCRN
jgi:serine/threonine-protein kinase RsbW